MENYCKITSEVRGDFGKTNQAGFLLKAGARVIRHHVRDSGGWGI